MTDQRDIYTHGHHDSVLRSHRRRTVDNSAAYPGPVPTAGPAAAGPRLWPEERAWWGSLWADRITSSALATQALDRHLATRQDLQDMADAWHHWAAHNDAWFTIPHGEILCRG
ncbi:MAG: hypothetical protein ACRDSR_02595 [Pseudonocardiaceae bacterium]